MGNDIKNDYTFKDYEYNGKKQARDWFITFPAKGITDNDVENAFKKYEYWVGKREVGKQTGYEHYHVYIETSSPIRYDTLKKMFDHENGTLAKGGRIERRKSTPTKAFEYVTKLDTKSGPILGNMDKPVSLKRGRGQIIEELRSLVLDENIPLSEVVLEYPEASSHINYLEKLIGYKRAKESSSKRRNDLKVHYIYGKPGVGKTKLVYDKYNGSNELYSVTDYSHPWDSYDNHSAILLDEYSGEFSFSFLLKLLDIYAVQLPARYNNKWASFNEVWILSNKKLDSLYVDEQRNPDRWNALLRRITTYEEMLPGGELVSRPKPRVDSH